MHVSRIFVAPEIERLIKNNEPVVALESTIISHGMPYPKNVQTALRAEEIVRENGATPATIAIINGIPTIGITKEQIDYIGKNGEKITKASKRDIPILIANKQDGATTVAATLFLASSAGIKVFATGGIGGVHRYFGDIMDISSDLDELSKKNVAVICAGAKSILDIGKTLEYLETKSIPIIGYQTNEFPAFFSRKSGFKIKYKMESPKQIADMLKIKWDLGIKGSVVIANPIPEKFDIYGDLIASAIESACNEAKEKGIAGNQVTPYLLDEINNLTQGKSLEANINLVYANVKLGAEIAREYSKIPLC
ncbi:MAG: pseudouridine-5'-phosphate glycosidase [Oscillospiraceae bacterium]|jgi:pseudouridine-5'-phosphate glycosidase|nr:pseudouridine-5'-phosphate glycosidase [Oscillospiraceae bacterium]